MTSSTDLILSFDLHRQELSDRSHEHYVLPPFLQPIISSLFFISSVEHRKSSSTACYLLQQVLLQ
jgi:hypothetical protein